MNTTKLATDNIPSPPVSSPQARLEKLQNDLAGIYNRITTQQKPYKLREILVVDENETIQKNVKTFLQSHGLKVTTTANSLDALNYFHNSSFHLILTPICVPGVNGKILLIPWCKNRLIFLLFDRKSYFKSLEIPMSLK